VKNFPPPAPPRGHTLPEWMRRNNEAGWHLTRKRGKRHDQPSEPDIERERHDSGWRPSGPTREPRRGGSVWRGLASIPLVLLAGAMGLMLLSALVRGRFRPEYLVPAGICLLAVLALPAIWRGRSASSGQVRQSNASSPGIVGGLFVVVVGIAFGALTTVLLMGPAKPIAIITGLVTLVLATWGRNLLRRD
jgi:hypothetical protein